MINKELILQYIEFKKDCIEQNIIDLDEIIKLFGVSLNHLE